MTDRPDERPPIATITCGQRTIEVRPGGFSGHVVDISIAFDRRDGIRARTAIGLAPSELAALLEALRSIAPASTPTRRPRVDEVRRPGQPPASWVDMQRGAR